MYLPMKRLIYLSMAVLMAALAVSCKKDSDKVSKSEGVLTTKEAWDLALPLTWTSNKEYEKTEDVYVKGKIVEIKELGYYVNGGTYGNASYTIASNETPHYTVYCFRILYLGNQKNVSVRDIQLGDDVIICGKLMNYQGRLIETVPEEAYLYSLNGVTEAEVKDKDTNTNTDTDTDTDPPVVQNPSFETSDIAQTCTSETDGTYGRGFSTTTHGLKIGNYRHTCSTELVAPNADHVRIYKNSALLISSVDGKKIKKIVISCAPDSGTSSYCFDMTGLEGGASAKADKSAKTITWSGSATKVVLHSNVGQVRMQRLAVEFES